MKQHIQNLRKTIQNEAKHSKTWEIIQIEATYSKAEGKQYKMNQTAHTPNGTIQNVATCSQTRRIHTNRTNMLKHLRITYNIRHNAQTPNECHTTSANMLKRQRKIIHCGATLHNAQGITHIMRSNAQTPKENLTL